MTGAWELHIAIKLADHVAVKRLLNTASKSSCNYNSRGKIDIRFRGESVLATAIKSHNLQILNILLKQGVDVCMKSTENGRNEPPLLTAVRYKKLDAVKTLIEHGADVRFQVGFYGHDAIFQAVIESAIDILDHLLAITQGTKFCHEEKNCPLLLALKYGLSSSLKRNCINSLIHYGYRCTCLLQDVSSHSEYIREIITSNFYSFRQLKDCKEEKIISMFEPLKLTYISRRCIINAFSPEIVKASFLNNLPCSLQKFIVNKMTYDMRILRRNHKTFFILIMSA